MPRPPEYDEPMERKNITIPPSLIARAKEIGNGQLSRGVRRAIEEYEEPLNKASTRNGDG